MVSPGSPLTLSCSTLAVPHLATRNLARKGAFAALQGRRERESDIIMIIILFNNIIIECVVAYNIIIPLHWCARVVVNGQQD